MFYKMFLMNNNVLKTYVDLNQWIIFLDFFTFAIVVLKTIIFNRCPDTDHV